MAVTPVLEKAYPTTVTFFQEIAQNCPQRYECASVAAQLEAVIAGVGVGVLPNYLANRFTSLVPVLPDVTCQRTYLADFASRRT